MQFQCRPMQYNTLQSQSLAAHNIALQNRCFAPLHQAPLNSALLRHSFALQCKTPLCLASATHCFTPPCHCVAEIRIAPQSLRCSSRPKTELSLPYAVLDCAALHLSATVLFNSLPFLCCAEQGWALPLPIQARPGNAFPLLFLAHRGDSFRCPAIACHCFSILRLRRSRPNRAVQSHRPVRRAY